MGTTAATVNMDYTLFLCKIMGLCLTIFMLGLLFNRKHFLEMASSLVSTPAMHFAATIVPLVLGAMVIVTHNVWSDGYTPMLVTLIGWIMFVSGVVRALLPTFWVNTVRNHYAGVLVIIVQVILFIIGIILLYCGFFM